jgi:hypothetical protein
MVPLTKIVKFPATKSESTTRSISVDELLDPEAPYRDNMTQIVRVFERFYGDVVTKK